MEAFYVTVCVCVLSHFNNDNNPELCQGRSECSSIIAAWFLISVWSTGMQCIPQGQWGKNGKRKKYLCEWVWHGLRE